MPTRSQVIERLQAIVKNNGTPGFHAHLTKHIVGTLADHFDRSAQGQGDWAPLTPRYQQWKYKHYPTTASLINIRTGRLRAAFEPGIVAGSAYIPPPEQDARITPNTISLRFNVPYARHVHKLRPLFPPAHILSQSIGDGAAEIIAKDLSR